MKKINSLLLTTALAFSAHAQAELTYLTARAALNPKTGQLLQQPAIIIENNKIKTIGSQKTLSAPHNAKRINLPDSTLLPGLMDMHVHLSKDAEDNFLASRNYSLSRQTVIAVKNARRSIEAGFTTVRNLGAAGYSVIGVMEAINNGDIPGPRIWTAGHSISVTGGHCDDNFSAPEKKSTAGGVADGPWAVRAKVRENIKYGANTIKICATGGVFSKGTKVGIQQYTQEELKAAADEAHLRGLIIAAHAHGTEGIKAAIKAGVDSIEHCSFLDQEAIDLAIQYGTYLSCDIYNTEYTLAFGEQNGVPQENIKKEKLVSKAQRDSFRAAVKAGAKMVFGSDAAIYPHGDNGKQFSRMVKFGMTPLQAIQAATINAADLLQQNDIGQIKSGFLADIIAVKGNPLDNISILENITFVMKDGQVIKHHK